MLVALVTGASGFIGSFVCERLLEDGWRVVGLDCMSDYYDVSMKEARESNRLQNENYRSIHDRVDTPNLLMTLFEQERPDTVIHLAAQAGVRHSIYNPRSYLESNIIGTFELLEAARAYPPRHMLLASTSSVYGANTVMPNQETIKADHQTSFYAATKKSTEAMAHSYAHLYGLPITMFRFFTVYGPWGRPDMALFKFTKAIMNGDPIDVYNFGDMHRDFTYVDDLVQAITLLINAVPENNAERHYLNDSLSPVAPFRVVNIGSGDSVQLTDFLEAIEAATGKRANRNLMPMQAGDVLATWADASLLQALTGYSPETSIQEGVTKFVEWYRDFYQV
jgi:UDP-glucuronate 4-epimerase